MRNTMLRYFTFLLLMFTGVSAVMAQTKKPPAPAAGKATFGALAIDKSNGFYYGFAYDHPTLAEAEKRAVEECAKRGGKGTVVLSWSGEACGAYRTIPGSSVNNAFGWGVAKTREEADAIATKECLKRSNGKPASNYVWACNSTSKTPFKIIRNDINNFKPVLQAYAVEDKGTSYLKFGDKVILSTTQYTFRKELVPGELFAFELRGDDYYKYINPMVVIDKNGVQQKFGGESFFEQIETFLPYSINEAENKKYEWGLVTVKEFLRNDKRFGASFHSDTHSEMEKAMVRWGDYPTEQRTYPNNFSMIYSDKLVCTDKKFKEEDVRTGYYCFQQYRYSQQRTNYKTERNSFYIGKQ